jgi:predicted phage terminase large subunit-like protein
MYELSIKHQLREAVRARLERRLSLASDQSAGESFLEWFERTKPKKYTVPHHVKMIGHQLQRIESGSLERLRIHMPPRHGKTETCTLNFPMYYMLRREQARVLITSYNQTNASRFSRTLRNRWVAMGQNLETSAASHWSDGHGRELSARGVGSPPTGQGFDLIIIDDPIKSRIEADSATYRDRVHAWFTDDLLTRLEPGGKIVLIATRWHHDDLAGRIGKDWETLDLPAIDENGNALWSERFPIDALNQIREQMKREEGEYSWEALYQQNPTPKTGSHFDIGKLQFIDVVPNVVETVRGWDFAATKGDGDYTAGVKIGRTEGGEFVLLDVVRGQWGALDVERMLAATAEADGRACKIAMPIDPGAAGKFQFARFQRLLSAFAVHGETVSGSKIVRSQALAACIEAGNLLIPRGANWATDFVEELRQFPNGRNDDQVDAAAESYNHLAGMGRVNRWEVF